ncbi:MAG: hypothetical protein AB4911_15615 [Oscillochloridaceae bacterium umkhey_bin13]
MSPHHDQAPYDPSRTVFERDLVRVRNLVQRWMALAPTSVVERQAILGALDGLLGDLEAVMQHLQERDGRA